jgi:hypothetical protein
LEVTGYLSREKVFVGQSIQQLNSSPDWGSYSKVILKTDEGEGYVAGDDSGLTLEAECPYANQAIADAVLASLQGKSYKPYDGSTAYITPAAEIGDGMTSDGFYSGIYSMSRKFSKVSAADIAAPSDTEVQHEIQYEPQSERKFTRKMKEISAEFAVLGDRINAIVKNDGEGFGWELVSTGMTWWAIDNNSKKTIMKIDKNGVEINGTATIPAVIAGQLKVGGTAISASTLRSGANSGYNWANGEYSSGGYTATSRAAYALSGGLNGYKYGSATTWQTNTYPSYFKADYINAVSTLVFKGNACKWQDKTLPDGTSYTFLVKET